MRNVVDDVRVLLLLLLQGYGVDSDELYYNYGQAKTAVEQYKEAIEVTVEDRYLSKCS